VLRQVILQPESSPAVDTVRVVAVILVDKAEIRVPPGAEAAVERGGQARYAVPDIIFGPRGVIDAVAATTRGAALQGEQLVDAGRVVEQFDAAGIDQRQQVGVQAALWPRGLLEADVEAGCAMRPCSDAENRGLRCACLSRTRGGRDCLRNGLR
jgi:hypothetical protein